MSSSHGPEQQVRVKILFFAQARELAGVTESELLLPARLASNDLKGRLIREFHLSLIGEVFVVALNESFVEEDTHLELREFDEIAVIPPLSGEIEKIVKSEIIIYNHLFLQDNMDTYQDFIGLESNVLNINDIIQSVTSASCGAVSSFIGTTRDNFEDKKVIKLEYEAYEPMALKQMRAVCNKIRSQWSVEKIAIYHRLGEVPVKEASIVIAISSPHRQESLLAVQYAIDAVKTSVPIWKKEIYAGHRPQWKENKECAWSTNKGNTINEHTDDFEIDKNSHMDHDYGVSPSDEHLKINPDEIQIKADDAEIKRRIEAFISLKKNSDTSDKPYIHRASRQNNDVENTEVCARVNCVYRRLKDSKSHITVGRAYNQWSHQSTQSSLPKKMKDETSNHASALEERLFTSEQFLGISKPVPKNVYERLKNIEDRLLYLECISPEYKFMWKRSTEINVDTDNDSNEKEVDSKVDSDYAAYSDYTANKKRAYSTDSEDQFAKKVKR